MHDWVLERIVVDWATRVVTFFLRWRVSKQISARNFTNLVVPRNEEWGRSESINSVSGPNKIDDKMYELRIEMQSGDLILVSAEIIEMSSQKGTARRASS